MPCLAVTRMAKFFEQLLSAGVLLSAFQHIFIEYPQQLWRHLISDLPVQKLSWRKVEEQTEDHTAIKGLRWVSKQVTLASEPIAVPTFQTALLQTTFLLCVIMTHNQSLLELKRAQRVFRETEWSFIWKVWSVLLPLFQYLFPFFSTSIFSLEYLIFKWLEPSNHLLFLPLPSKITCWKDDKKLSCTKLKIIMSCCLAFAEIILVESQVVGTGWKRFFLGFFKTWL